MNHNSCIYCIENTINGKKYIGQTKDFHKRMLSHLSALRNGRSHNRHLQSAFEKYGESAFLFYVIEECDISILNEREQHWIAELKTLEDGYNLDMGGEGIRGYHFTEEQRKHISNALKGRIVSDEAKRKMSENHADFSGNKNRWYGVPWRERISPETQEAVRRNASLRYSGANNPNYRKKMSDEQKKKISKSRKARYAEFGNPLTGRKRPSISDERHYKAHSVVCLNTNEVFPTIKSASQKYGVSASSISSCCSNTVMSAGKAPDGMPLFWRYEDDFSRLTGEDIKSTIDGYQTNRAQRQNKKVRCITTGEVFQSMKMACEKYHIDPSSLSRHCSKKKSINGCGRHPETKELLKWEYV